MSEPLLRVDGLSKQFGGTAALDRVSLTLPRGASLGLIGASGSGKSTLARCIARFERPDSGTVTIDGRADYARHDVQLIFQEAAASLNPRFTAREILEEPSRILKRPAPDVETWLAAVGLPAAAAGKRALAFSGGERQRLAIARALIVEPKLLILDESFSGLDLLLQAQMTSLLADLRRRFSLTCILIAHDLALAARVSDEIRVMSRGLLLDSLDDPRAVELFEASRALSLKGALG